LSLRPLYRLFLRRRNMKLEKLTKILEAIEAQGYEIITFDASRLRRATMEIGIPAFVNAQGLPVNPEDTDRGPEKPALQRAMEAMESAGFHVNRAYEENNRDAGNSIAGYQEHLTGAICLRITPVKPNP
jgi:sporulation-control protein spo0M